MEKGEFMTYPGQTIFLRRIFGIFTLLLLTSPLTSNSIKDTYITLGEEFNRSGQDFLSYQNYISAYLLEEDSDKSIELGLKALKPCLNLNRLNEASWLINSLSLKEDNREYYQTLMALILVKTDNLNKADDVISILDLESNNRAKLINSYYYFLKDDYTKTKEILSTIKNSSKQSEVNDILDKLNTPLDFKRKSPLLALTLSSIIPGSGQIYSGLTYDGINSFIINGLLGGTAATAWYYEINRDHDKRNYTLPIISTLAFSFFYITNLYNSYNSANRYNSYNESRYYDSIFNRLQLIIEDSSYFIGYRHSIY